MEISSYNRTKITILNSILILMVLYIHSYYTESDQFQVASFIARFFSGYAFCGTANRLFFLLAGFLFFNNLHTAKDCYYKIKKRVKSLLVPYLIWNCVFVLWYIVLGAIPGIKTFVNSDVLSNFDTVYSVISYLFIQPANFPLWFLRDLMILVLFSPLILFILKKTGIGGVLVYHVIGYFFPIFGFWFVLGAGLAYCTNLERIEKVLSPTVVIISSIYFLSGCVYVSLNPEYVMPDILGSLMGFSGLIMVWRGYDYVIGESSLLTNEKVRSLFGYSFFVYLFHEPAFNIIKKIPVKLFGVSEPTLILFYIINPLVMFAIAILLAKLLQRIVPNLYSVLVGGR